MRACLAVVLLAGWASPQTVSEALRLVGEHAAVWTAPPTRTPADHSVDGPLMGNGDLKVALGGAPQEQRFHLAKNDLWRLESGRGNASPVSLGELSIRIPGLAGASYEVRQSWAEPRTVGTFATAEGGVRMTSRVAATRNLLLLRLEAEGRAFEVDAVLRVISGRGSTAGAGRRGDLLFARRAFLEGVEIPSGAAAVSRVYGAEVTAAPGATPTSAGVRFTLAADRPVTLILAMESLIADPDYAESAIGAVESLALSDLEAIEDAHAAWWIDYWARSFVEIGDPALERHYWRSLYSMGAASRDPRFPPGIFGWVTTDSPSWQGDYHTNYNHVAPYYALYSANRLEQGDPQDAPILAFRERGRWYAEEVTGTRGVLYPVGIGPLGIETTRVSEESDSPNHESGGMFYQQRSNAAYCLVNMAQRWRCTYDLEYGRVVYPFVREVMDFWEDYLRFEEGRYLIVGDAIHEGSGQNVNPILTLGLLRNAFDLALDMSRELEVDAGRRQKWRHVLDHLSGWTTQERDGRTVFRYTERGTEWWGDNTLGIQHVYPGNALGLDSDPEWLAVARDTITTMDRWIDFNGSNSFFPAAVRVGYDPEVILDRLRAFAAHTYPNGFQLGNPHGIENFSTTPNAIDMMLCMGHVPAGAAPGTQVLRVFPVWPMERDARFADLRTWGAFLVSSELSRGRVSYVRIASERGRDCTVVNPWPDEEVVVRRPRGAEEIVRGARFTLGTSEGEVLLLEPRSR